MVLHNGFVSDSRGWRPDDYFNTMHRDHELSMELQYLLMTGFKMIAGTYELSPSIGLDQ